MGRIYFIIAGLFLFISCEKMLFEKDVASVDPEENFAYLWNECHKKYAYFELKGVDWETIKIEYSAKLYPEMTEDSLFNVLGAMLDELRDGHTNLIANDKVSLGISEFGQDNYNENLLLNHYLSDSIVETGPFYHDYLEEGEIGYLRLSKFTGTVKNSHLTEILNRFKNTKGLIIDLRENRGGVAKDVFKILSRFVEEKTLVYYSRIKTGEGNNDFSEPEPTYVYPYDGVRYLKKTVVLTDRRTYSAGSFFALATKAIDNLIMVGDTTGGGLGVPNGGQMPNGWRYRITVSQALTLDKNPAYEEGVPPDVLMISDWTNATTDEILEQALLELQ